jgi:hypothetical protein
MKRTFLKTWFQALVALALAAGVALDGVALARGELPARPPPSRIAHPRGSP